MSKEEFLKIQKCVLKVNIHCDGCKQKVKKILQKIDGVFTIEIDAEAGKVTVSGNVDPAILIKKLSKSKKYAEIWGAPKVNPNTNNGGQHNQMKNLQIENGAKAANNQPKPSNGGGGAPMQISPQMFQQMQQMNGFPQLKGLQMPPSKDLIPAKQKAVKFEFPEEDDLTDDDDYDDDYDDYDDDDDDFEDGDLEDDLDDTPAPPNKMKPGGTGGGANAGQMPNMMMMNRNMNMNMNMHQLMNAQKAAMGAEKKSGSSGGGAMPILMNGMGSDGKGGKKGVAPKSGGGGEGNQGHDSDGSRKKGEATIENNMGFTNMGGSHGMSARGMAASRGDGTRPMGSMNMPMAQMGNMQMSQMGSIPAVHGLPAAAMNSGGYFSRAVGPTEAMGGNPYQRQQHQTMEALMNQQRPIMANQPMMYARPPSAVNYLSPYPYLSPQPSADNYSHFFNDENTASCNVM